MQGSELRALREGMGLSQSQLANELGLSRVFIGLMERGEKPIERRTELALHFLAGSKRLEEEAERAPEDEPADRRKPKSFRPRRLRDGEEWGAWKFEARTYSLVYRRLEASGDPDEPFYRREIYDIPLVDFYEPRMFLRWLGQIADKDWPAEDLGNLVRALDRIFNLSGIGHSDYKTNADGIRAEINRRLGLIGEP